MVRDRAQDARNAVGVAALNVKKASELAMPSVAIQDATSVASLVASLVATSVIIEPPDMLSEALSAGMPTEPSATLKELRPDLYKKVRKKAMNLLTRREHAVAELEKKLNAKDYDADIVSEVVAQLAHEGLVSDARFTEAFVRYRHNMGYGPRRIQRELRERGVNEKIQASYLDIGDPQWFEQAAQVQRKRFGDDMPEDFKERARRARFLQYRGFTSDQIREVLNDIE